ncbi:MAG: sugar phosphate isomerase/epimerase [Pirellulales bacterium]|nr:sugar phosphate isomerase/epimerase [Pirellulales bacterium]
MPLRKALVAAAELGCEGVELDARNEVPYREFSQTAVRQLRVQLADLRLRVAALSFVTRRGYNVIDELDRRVDATKQVMKLARALGADLVINQVGRVPQSADDPDWPLLIEVLRDLGDFGQHSGALLCAETGSEAGPTLLHLIEALPDGALGVALNPGALLYHGFDPNEATDKLGAFVRHVMAVDGDRARGRGTVVPLGSGSVDFPALLGELEECDYRGYISVAPTNAVEPLAEAQRAIGYLRNL